MAQLSDQEEIARYQADVKRNTTSLTALYRAIHGDKTIPLDFIESVAESLAYQQSLVRHYKQAIACKPDTNSARKK